MNRIYLKYSGIAAGVCGGILALCVAVFDASLNIAGSPIPDSVFAVLAIVLALVGGYALHCTQQMGFQRFVSIVLLPAVSVVVGRSVWNNIADAFEMVAVVLFAAMTILLLKSYTSQMVLWKPGIVRGIAWAAVCCTAVLTLFVRSDPSVNIHVAVIVLLSMLWMYVLLGLPEVKIVESGRWSRSVWLIGIALVILWGAWLRIAAVDTFVFQNDEYFHVNASVGYLETGEYYQWNFLRNEVEDGEEYTRAWPYTWQVAQSVNVLGQDAEWKFRLPTLLWGILLLVVMAAVTFSWTRSYAVAMYSTALVAFDNGFIWASTYNRMYAFLGVFVLLSVWLFSYAIRSSGKSAHRVPEKVQRIPRWVWLVVALVSTAFTVLIHQAAVLLLGGMAIALVCYACIDSKDVWYRHLVYGIAVLGVIAGLVHLLHPFLPFDFVALRVRPALEYIAYPLHNMKLPFFALILCISGLIIARKKSPLPAWIYVAASMSFPAITYFAYFSNRYPARKYSMFVFPFIYMIIGFMWHRFMKQAFPRTWATVGIGVFAFMWMISPVSIPGQSASLFLDTARSDYSYDNVQLHDYATGYSVIEEMLKPGDTVYILSERSYYLTRTDVNNIQIPPEEQWTLQDVQQAIEQTPQGYIVWPKYKAFHFSPAVIEYIRTNLERVDDPILKDSNIVVYQWK